MSTDDICPICKNPKSTTPGSMTQWIAACSCDSAPLEIEEAEQIKVNICKTCGKRIGDGRSGSFTQFIFRSDTCQCERPVFEDENNYIESGNQGAIDEDLESTYNEVIYEDAEEEELQLDEPDKFPIDRYKPVKLLGSGSSGSVYVARDNLLNKRVAVKILSEFNSKAMVAFQNEAKNTVQLSHPSIIEILDFGVTKAEAPYMVLEYFPGLSLEEELQRKGSLGWEDIRAIIANICDAVSYANQNNIYHRDIKPSNILILDSNPENVRLIDFGIASVKGYNKESPSSKNSEFVGTPLYMSPEASSGKPYDSRSEVYSLSCVLYKAFTGKPPFEGETVLETLTMHKEYPRPQIANESGSIFVAELNKLFKKGMAIDPDERFKGARALKEALFSIDASATTIDTSIEEVAPEKTLNIQKNKSLVINLVCFICIGTSLVTAYILFFTPEIIFKDRLKALPSVEKIKERSDHIHEKTVVKEAERQEWIGKKWSYKGNIVKGIEVDDNDFKSLKLGPKISSLRINGASTSFTGTGFRYITNHPLKRIEISAMGFNDEGALEVSKFKHLYKVLVQHNRAMTIKGLTYLTNIKGLKFLSLRFLKLPKGGADLIAKSDSIQIVELGHISNITKEDIEKICAKPKLIGLLIANANVDDSIVPVIMQRDLTQLNINGTKISGVGLLKLGEIKTLKHIKISLGNGITDSDLKLFKRTFKKCKLSLDNPFAIDISDIEDVKNLALPSTIK